MYILRLPEEVEAQAYLAAIITSSDDAIISKDLNGNITSWNPSAERIFGFTAEEAVGKHITLIIPQDKFAEEDYIIGQIKQGNRVEHFETVRRTKHGSFVNISVTISPIKNKEGVIIGASKVARDISDRLKVQQALDETGRKKDEFLANMSHELRTPMNAVIGLAGFLKTMPGLPEKATKFIDTLKVSADNLMDLINDLLDFAKIESGAVELEKAEFSLAEQIEKAVSVSNVRAREKGLALHVNYAPSLNCYYIGDPLRVHQVLMNLLSNAIKFTEKGSVELDISGSAETGDDKTIVTFRVSDTGIGIPDNKLGAIFDKFSQADSSITRRFGGSGLGLAICKALTDKMGGTVSVCSQVGTGTTFIVKLPLKNSKKSSSVESFSATAAAAVPIDN
jgi:PAS domain S-box-containing protein